MRILLVDDEPNVLKALNRQLRLKYEVDTAGSGEEALKKVRESGPYAVVVSDLSMPGMDGIELLREVAKIHNATVRIILTGNADQRSAIDAINKGEAFRFLTKPCFGFALQNEIDAGVELYRLRVSEKELLEKTLAGSIGILTEMLAIVNPQAFGRTQSIKKIVVQLADTLDLQKKWQYKIAAMLSMIGFITVPQDTLEKFYNGEELSREEDKIIEEHSKIAVRLVSKIPRLNGIAK
ncbi:MAG: response regulator, partial [FCB group bacterium]|nr:response regulator [FCB group bacterium]